MDLPVIRKVCWAFTPILAAPTRARRRLAEQLRLWGVTESESESVLLVANELVANAVDHARTAFELAVSFDGTAVVVEVCDESMLEPRLQPINPTAARGRGLQMVEALSKSWSCIGQAGGKTVRAVIVVGFLVRCAMYSLLMGSGRDSTLGASQRLFAGFSGGGQRLDEGSHHRQVMVASGSRQLAAAARQTPRRVIHV